MTELNARVSDLEMRTKLDRARRVARRCGLVVRKSRVSNCVPNCDDRGGLMLIAIDTNIILAGARFDLSPDEVLAICERTSAPQQS